MNSKVGTQPSRKAKVLLADDEPIFADTLGRILRMQGYNVLTANRARQALEIVRTQGPVDVVVSDVHMPEMSGTYLARELQQTAPQTACMLLTEGIVNLADVPHGVRLLRKPISRPDLVAAIEETIAVLAERNTERETGAASSSKEEVSGFATQHPYVHSGVLRAAATKLLQVPAEDTPDILLITDSERRYVDINDAAIHAFGTAREAVIGRRVDDFFSMADHGSVPSCWQEFVQLGQQVGSCELLTDGAKFDYRAAANFLPGLHAAILPPSNHTGK